VTIGAFAAEARRALEQAGVQNPTQETQWLMEYILYLKSHQLVSGADQPLSDDAWDRAERVFARRASREPLQYILGTQEFCGLEFTVSADVLIPRPETELLVQEVVRRGVLKTSSTVVEVGTGSGCIAVALATVLQEARIIGIDRSAQALTVAKGNAAKHAVDRRIEWLEGDLLSPLTGQGLDGRVDVIVSNPPYIAEAEWEALQPEVRLFEPREALVAGDSGTEIHERLLHEAQPFLAPAGVLLMEIGQGQAGVIRRLAEDVGGYAPLQRILDTNGIDRVVVLQLAGQTESHG
jgi:release factor glutamine methyltransferase